MEYKLAIPGGIDAALEELQNRHDTQLEPVARTTRTYLDTFDWRLYEAGLCAEIEHEAAGHKLVLRRLDDASVWRSAHYERVPRFACDLPAGVVRDELTDIVEMRALLERASAEVHLREIRYLNRDAKTVAAIDIEHVVLLTPDDVRDGSDGRRRLGTIARVVPVRGYDKAARRARRTLEDDLGLVATEPLAIRILEAAGNEPGDYSSKIRLSLEADEPATRAFRAILRSFLETMLANVPGVRDDIDTEFLHDFRVSVRRARSIVSQAKGVFEPALRRYMRDELRWVGTITTPVRDLDVHLLDLDSYRTPDTPDAALAELRSYLEKRRMQAQSDLVAALDAPRFAHLVASWTELVRAQRPAEPEAPPDADTPIIAVAGRRTWKAYKLVTGEGRSISPRSPEADLHELRKSAKQLRYLLESFRSLYRDDDMSSVIKELKQIQDVLGEFQDTVVHAQELTALGTDMAAEGSASSETMMAMGSMIDRMQERRHEARGLFMTRFEHFDRRENRRRFESLFSPKRSGGPS